MTLAPLPAQPAGVPWPTQDWPTGPAPAGLEAFIAEAMANTEGPLGATHAVVVVQGGRLRAEAYATGPDTTEHSWSMAKSITQSLAGILVKDGRIDIHAPADVPEWAGDSRARITLDQLIRMSSGLKFQEDYDPTHPSDVIAMLFGEGKDDVAGFAAAFPLEHAPGTWFSYASGSTNIVSRALAQALGVDGAGFEAFMRQRLFAPLGMKSPTPKFDAAGTFIGSSFCFCTPRDFARYGLLNLRGGVWDGQAILPPGWVDYARTPTFQQPDYEGDGYGAGWWLGLLGPDGFSANGYDGQLTALCPHRDLVIVRNGKTPQADIPTLKAWMKDLAGFFD